MTGRETEWAEKRLGPTGLDIRIHEIATVGRQYSVDKEVIGTWMSVESFYQSDCIIVLSSKNGAIDAVHF